MSIEDCLIAQAAAVLGGADREKLDPILDSCVALYLANLDEDGQVDFKTIFSKLTQYNYPGWAVMEWECCIKHPEDGAREGAEFIQKHIIRVTEKAFDDFAGTKTDDTFNRSVLGLK